MINIKHYSISFFGGIFKDIFIKLNNKVEFKDEILDPIQNEKINTLALINFHQFRPFEVANGLKNDTLADKDGVGYLIGLNFQFKNIEFALSRNMPENTINQSFIYRMNSNVLSVNYIW